MTEDERFMTRAIELARRPSFTSPNPRVGAVLVRGGSIISEGIHEGSGTPHAEATALEGLDAAGATLYVNLEPCVHHGKTPPCAPAVVAAGIERVVVAIEDPDPRVAGRGIETLEASGIEVTMGVCEPAATELNRTYLHQRRTRRVSVSLKLALSLDGKVAAADGSSRWITGEGARLRVHRRRLESDGVLVGAGTVVADDPSLTVRDVDAPRQPIRVLCDATGKVAPTSRIFEGGEVIVMTTATCPQAIKSRWKETGAEVVDVPGGERGGVDLDAVIENLTARGWLEVFCEGGAEIATSLLRADLVDRLELNYGPLIVGGSGLGLGDLGIATIDEASRWRSIDVTRIDEDIICILDRAR